MAHLIADPFRTARLVLALRRRGITDDGVLSAIETIDRAAFVSPDLQELAGEDCALPIPCGQTILRPLITAHMMRALSLSPGKEQRILVVGSGSGYVSVLLSQLGRHIYGVERYSELVETSRARLAALDVSNVTVHQGDGLIGLLAHGPYERVLLTGSVSHIPESLLQQLTRTGVLVAPIHSEGPPYKLYRYGPTGHLSQEVLPEPVPKLYEAAFPSPIT